MIPRGSWIKAFARLMEKLPGDGTIALIGVGSRDNGDDAMGPMVIDILRKGLENKAETAISRLVLFDGGAYPEALSGELKRIKPSVVVFIDAVAAPDGNRCFMAPLSEIKVRGGGGSTHKASLGIYAGYLTAETGADVWLLGIPLPRHTDLQESAIAFGSGLSEAARTKSGRVAAKLLDQLWQPCPTAHNLVKG